jgi:hypothetical protein
MKSDARFHGPCFSEQMEHNKRDEITFPRPHFLHDRLNQIIKGSVDFDGPGPAFPNALGRSYPISFHNFLPTIIAFSVHRAENSK